MQEDFYYNSFALGNVFILDGKPLANAEAYAYLLQQGFSAQEASDYLHLLRRNVHYELTDALKDKING